VGISIALLGGPRFAAVDDWAALVACLVIGFNGVRLLRESGNELMDASVPQALMDRVRTAAAGVEGVVAIEKCRVRKVGLDLAMDIHVVVDGDATVRRGHEIAHAVKDRLLASSDPIADVTVHVEPHDASHGPQVHQRTNSPPEADPS
jgi:cation diffusion facilitator family transporter